MNHAKHLKILIIAVLGFSCSKTQDISSLKIVGSNTDYNNITILEDGSSVLLKKNEINILKNSEVATLNTNTIAMPSVDIERVMGNIDTLFLLGKSELSVYFPSKASLVTLPNFEFSHCDQIAKVDSFVVWTNGGTACQPTKIARLNLLVLNKKTELVLKEQKTADAVYSKLVVFKKLILGLTNGGIIDIYQIKDNTSLVRLSQIKDAKATDLSVFGDRILIKNDTGILQYKLKSDYSASKVNQINIGSL